MESVQSTLTKHNLWPACTRHVAHNTTDISYLVVEWIQLCNHPKLSAWQAVREGWDMTLHCTVWWWYGLLHFTVFFLQTDMFWRVAENPTKASGCLSNYINKVFITTDIRHALLPQGCFCKHCTYKIWTTGLCPSPTTNIWNQTSL